MLCLDGSYRKSRSCGKVPTQGFAMHPYTTKFGPFFQPQNQDDVTIGVLPRLVKALDRAASAGALPRRLPVYVSEFGVQSYPDRVSGVPLPTQSDFRSIGEHIAWGNARVKSFSQYLLRDDRTIAGAHGAFESGLFLFKNSAPKPAFYGFRLPLVVTKGKGVERRAVGLRAACARACRQPRDPGQGPQRRLEEARDAALRRQRLLEAQRDDEGRPPVARRVERPGDRHDVGRLRHRRAVAAGRGANVRRRCPAPHVTAAR